MKKILTTMFLALCVAAASAWGETTGEIHLDTLSVSNSIFSPPFNSVQKPDAPPFHESQNHGMMSCLVNHCETYVVDGKTFTRPTLCPDRHFGERCAWCGGPVTDTTCEARLKERMKK